MIFKPKCTIANGWSDRRGCGKDAVGRNKFGGFECVFHHSLPKNTQPDSFFNKGVLVQEIDEPSFRLTIAYLAYKALGVRLFPKEDR